MYKNVTSDAVDVEASAGSVMVNPYSSIENALVRPKLLQLHNNNACSVLVACLANPMDGAARI